MSLKLKDAGMPGLNRFSGAVIIDDAHKPDEVLTQEEKIKLFENFIENISEGEFKNSIIDGLKKLKNNEIATAMLNKVNKNEV